MRRDPIGKPVDLGSGVVCGSFDPASAAWLSIGTPHPAHGFIELSAGPPFDESRRGDPAATREHRARLAAGADAIVRVDAGGRSPTLVAELADPLVPRWLGDGTLVEAWAPPDGAVIVQRWRFDAPRAVEIRLAGRLDRPSLAEVTELDPPMPTGARTTLLVDGGRAIVRAEALPAVGVVDVRPAPTWRTDSAGELRASLETGELTIAVGLLAGAEPPVIRLRPPSAGDGAPADRLTRGALSYIRGCTALRVAPSERAILTDHRLLPLSWTRDAYWQALALLAADGPGDRDRVADHLRWLWTRCERPDGRWVRSHHADGRRKDRAFQADQQLYPFVELADHWRLAGALPSGVAWSPLVDAAWEAVRAAVDPGLGLMATAENAADDPALAPFLGPSQILLWYAAERLAELGEATGIGPPPARLRAEAAAARRAFAAHHASGDGPWAYAVDGGGARVAYHDANDLPVALAPILGFCRPDDPGWRATMAFAFGPANPGWAPGTLGGLGSVHTPGAWTLGDIQAWIRARAVGDAAGMAAALDRLHGVAFGDGMLPEAYGPDGTPLRHWFAWPGAALAALRLLDGAGRLEAALGVRRR